MLEKSFEELVAYDISDYTSTRDGIEYLPWGNCLFLLRKLGAEKAFFAPVINPETHSSLFMTDKEFRDSKGNVNRCYEVAVKITIDDDEFEMRTPVMNGANPVKDNSLSQQRVWAAQCRAFVKGVAMKTGLGFNLWLKGDIESDFADDVSSQDIKKYLEKLQQIYTTALCKTKNKKTAELAKAIDVDEDEIGLYFKTYVNGLAAFEKKLTDFIAQS